MYSYVICSTCHNHILAVGSDGAESLEESSISYEEKFRINVYSVTLDKSYQRYGVDICHK